MKSHWRRILSFVDLVIEVADARLPSGSRNPALISSLKGKTSLLILNKADLADPKLTTAWKSFIGSMEAVPVLPLAAHSGKGIGAVERALSAAGQAQHTHRNRPLRAIILGIPNVGKSTIINRLLGRGAAATGAAPGITKGEQWLRLRPGMELLDTPGHLAARNDVALWQLLAIRAVVGNEDTLGPASEELIGALASRYGRQIAAYYGLSGPISLRAVAQSRGFLSKGNELDLARAASAVLTDFNRGRWGAITLEELPEPQM